MSEETIAGVRIPDSALAHEATEFVRDAFTELLFDHSRRVFLWAALQREKLGVGYDPELLYVGVVGADFDACGRTSANTSEARPSSPGSP